MQKPSVVEFEFRSWSWGVTNILGSDPNLFIFLLDWMPVGDSWDLTFKLFSLYFTFLLTVHCFFAADQGLFCFSGGFVQQSYCFYSKSWHKHVHAYSWFSRIWPQRSGYKYLISGTWFCIAFLSTILFFPLIVYFLFLNIRMKHFIEFLGRDYGLESTTNKGLNFQE